MRRALPAVALLSLFAVPQADAQFRPEAPAVGEDFHVELAMNFWQPTPSIVIGSDSLRTVSATGVDFVNEFDIPNTRFREFRAVLHGGKSKLRISHVDMKYNEATTLQKALIISGRPIDVAAAATADLEWDLWRIGYEHDFVKNPRGLLGFVVAAFKIKCDANEVLRLGLVIELVTPGVESRDFAELVPGLRQHRARLFRCVRAACPSRGNREVSGR